jgi:hypothetical protein
LREKNLEAAKDPLKKDATNWTSANRAYFNAVEQKGEQDNSKKQSLQILYRRHISINIMTYAKMDAAQRAKFFRVGYRPAEALTILTRFLLNV